MANFPKLRTGAAAQYPAARTVSYSTQISQFVDGSEQRFRNYAKPLHKWTIQLDLLDDGEMAELENFFLDNSGRLGTFSFTDPWDNTVYSSCSVQQDQFQLSLRAEAQAGTQLIIQENRS
jgi:Conserved hypothetical protein 2217 (DUF2460)